MQIRKSVMDGMVSDAKKRSPNEACGYLAGSDGVAEAIFPLTNVDESPEHFSLNPNEQFACVKAIRSRKMRLQAVYHSHPASPARPSHEDIRLSIDPDLRYVIVSLQDSIITIKAFVIKNGIVEEEPVTVV